MLKKQRNVKWKKHHSGTHIKFKNVKWHQKNSCYKTPVKKNIFFKLSTGMFTYPATERPLKHDCAIQSTFSITIWCVGIWNTEYWVLFIQQCLYNQFSTTFFNEDV